MLEGAILDRFTVTAPLARGGMGELWLAQDESAACGDVVLKTIRADLTDDHDVRRSFSREIHVTSQLDHAHVVRHVAHGNWQGNDVLALQHIRGVSLAELCRRKRMPLGAALCVAKDIADALAYVHRVRSADGAALGCVHGDVSPQNILVDTRGNAHLIDFGAVKLADDPAVHDVIGKAGYLSPEQSRGERIAPASDQYSLGIVVWELVTGAELFEDDARRRGRDIAAPSALVRVGREIDDVVLHMLAFDAAARYETCCAASRAIEAITPMPESAARAWLSREARRPRDERERIAAWRPTTTTVAVRA